FIGPGYDENARNSILVAIDAATGRDRALTARHWDHVSAVAWPRDGTLLVAGSERNKTNAQIWRVAAADGAIARVTNDLNDYHDLDAAAGAPVMVTILRDAASTLLAGEPSALRPVTDGAARVDGRSALTWTPGGKLIFSAVINGQLDLWMTDADGRN